MERRVTTQHQCDDICDPAIRLYQEGFSLVAISARLDLSTTPIHKRLQTHGIKLRSRGRPRGIFSPWKDQAIQLWNEGRTLQTIGTVIGVTRERVRQVLQRGGIDTKSRRGHRCNNACAVSLAATPPVSVTRLARQAGLSWGRMQRAVQIHNIPTTRGHHVCTDRCARARELLATGMSIRQVGRLIGFKDIYLSQRYATYHPDWNWSRKQILPADGLTVSDHVFHNKASS